MLSGGDDVVMAENRIVIPTQKLELGEEPKHSDHFLACGPYMCTRYFVKREGGEKEKKEERKEEERKGKEGGKF